MKQKSNAKTFRMNQTNPGIQVKGAMSNGASQPPRNNTAPSAESRIMLAYSPRKKSAKVIPEYSTL